MTNEFKLIGLYSPRPQSGKSTAALYLKESGVIPDCLGPFSFASPLKTMAMTFLRCLGYDKHEAHSLVFERKEEIIPEINKTSRYVLQTLGTEWGRELIGQNLWIEIMRRRLENCRKKRFSAVIDDVRFFNEAQMIKSLGGSTWKIVRPGLIPPRGHASEGSLNDWDGFDHVIVNDGSLQDLYDKIDALLKNAG